MAARAHILFTAIAWRDELGTHTASSEETPVVDLPDDEFKRLEALGAVRKASGTDESAAKVLTQQRSDEQARQQAHVQTLSAPLAQPGRVAPSPTPQEEFAIVLEEAVEGQQADALEAADETTSESDAATDALLDAGSKAQLEKLAEEAEVTVSARASKGEIAAALAAQGFTPDDLS